MESIEKNEEVAFAAMQKILVYNDCKDGGRPDKMVQCDDEILQIEDLGETGQHSFTEEQIANVCFN